jgi:hypothetical protein
MVLVAGLIQTFLVKDTMQLLPKLFFYTGLYSSGLIKVVAHFEERCHLKCAASDDPSLMLEYQRSIEIINVEVIRGSVTRYKRKILLALPVKYRY